ncbi:MAG: PTS sugar transporter subunit IIA [Anaerolineaceae bacterium]|nr:MAG: PTS sugar transporter subunit IIA [Anaerolineaceae bacterium]
MVGVLVVAHGEMASGLLDAARMIVGDQEALLALSLQEMEDVEGLMDKVEGAISQVDTGEGVLVLVDLPGASPFNASARIAMQREGIEVVTGVNLPMLAELLVMRDGSSLEELVDIAKEAGISGVRTLSEILEKK